MEHQKIKSLSEYEKLLANDDKYRILDVDEDASEDEIEISFDELFGILSDSDEEDSEDKLAIISDAYGTLIDPDERKKLYLKKVINKLYRDWGVKDSYYYKKERLLGDLTLDSEIKEKDYFSLKRISDARITDKIINILNPYEYFVTVDERNGGGAGSLIEQPSGRLIHFGIYPGTEDGKVMAIGGGLHLVRVRVIPVDVDEMFELVIEKIRGMFPSRDLSGFFFNGSEREQKKSIRNGVKERYRTMGYVAAEEVIEDTVRSLLEELSKIGLKPEPEELPTPTEPIITPPRFVDDYFITEDERKKGSAGSVVEEASGRRIEFEIPPGVEDGRILVIEGDANFVRVRVMPVDVDEIFEYLHTKIRERFPLQNIGGFIDGLEWVQKDYIRDQVKEQYRTVGYVAVEEMLEVAVQSLRWELRRFGEEAGGLKSASETPTKTNRRGDGVKYLRHSFSGMWKRVVKWCSRRL